MADRKEPTYICHDPAELPDDARVKILHDEDEDEEVRKEDLPQVKIVAAARLTP